MVQEKRMTIKFLSVSLLSTLVTFSSMAMNQELVLRSDVTAPYKRMDVLVVAEEHKTENITPLKNIVKKDKRAGKISEPSQQTSFLSSLNPNAANRAVFQPRKIEISEQEKKEQEKKAKKEKKAHNEEAKALQFKANVEAKLNERAEYFDSFNDFQLIETKDRKKSVKRPTGGKRPNITNNQPVVCNPIVTVDQSDYNYYSPVQSVSTSSSEESDYRKSTSTSSSEELAAPVLRSANMLTPTLRKNVHNAEEVKQLNLTVPKKILKNNDKRNQLKTLNLKSKNSGDEDDVL
jgi:hypothetical protein